MINKNAYTTSMRFLLYVDHKVKQAKAERQKHKGLLRRKYYGNFGRNSCKIKGS